MEKIYRAAKYIRTSCPDDATNYRDSVTNQNRLINGFLQKHPEIKIVSEKVDDGYSGLFFDRPAYSEMIDDIKSGFVDCVIVKDLSRIGRDYIVTGRYLRDFFPEYGVRFISVNDNIDSFMLDGFEKILTLIKTIFSDQYSRDISIKTRSVLDEKRRQGKYVGSTPIYGYQKVVENKNQLAIDSYAATVVKSIFSMKLQGMSAAKIAKNLNQEGVLSPLEYKRRLGIPHPTGGFADRINVCWSATTILRILRDENYTGTLVQGRSRSLSHKTKIILVMDESEWIKSENSHPPIISKIDFNAVQRVLMLDTRAAPYQSKVHIFSGLLFCGCCSGNITRKITKSVEKDYIYYYCPKTKSKGCPSSFMIKESTLIHKVSNLVKKHIKYLQIQSNVIYVNRVLEIQQTKHSQLILDNDKKVVDLIAFKSLLFDGVSNGLINDTEFQYMHEYDDVEIARLNTESNKLRLEILNKRSHFATTEFIQEVLKINTLDELDRTSVVKMIRSIHILDNKQLSVEWIYP